MHCRVKVLLQPLENLIGSQTFTLFVFANSQFKLGPKNFTKTLRFFVCFTSELLH
jgi:hypothetical protein